MIDISHALTLGGWTSEAELTWLAEQASKRLHILEVGSWMGRSAAAMAANTKGTVTAVDTWKGTPADGHFKQLQGKPEDWLLETCRQNLSVFTNVRMLQGPSLSIVKTLQQSRFDMIFIDGDHSYEAVRADILAWLPLLSPGGLFIGHDYDGGRPGVVKAVKECFPGKHHKVGVGSIWQAT